MIAPHERVEDALVLVKGYTWAAVFNPEPTLPDNQTYPTFVGVVQRVSQKIGHYRTQEGVVVRRGVNIFYQQLKPKAFV